MPEDVSISRFFESIGMRLHNARWSWGAQRDHVIVLRTWEDQCLVRERRVAVLHQRTLMESVSAGLDERVQQLKAIWQGGIAAYTVIAAAVDPTLPDRTIKSYRGDLFAIDELQIDGSGTFYARYSRVLTPAEFRVDTATHRSAAGEGLFPVDAQMESGLSSATVREKLPLMREWLIGVARNRAPVQYAELMRRFDLWYGTLFTSLKQLGQACVAAGEPVITALVVDKETGRCSKGFKDVFGIEDDEAERTRCYAYWSVPGAAIAASGSGAASDDHVTSPPDSTSDDLAHEYAERVARFMSVEVRPQQSAFRRAVFVACGGKCVVSGCDVPEALEAAHLHGRIWRDGHNQASDGILLRRDLHGLYDRELLDLSEGVARFDGRVLHHYEHLEGLRVAALSERAS
ncbi:HNH endonuclease signature motif containing protein [Burkholderia stagnalis]|uniref:HNH endonuclease signature motif containing protein n=1 Tax=Burkholderia stagnalis TaxID=1503054 RepID=UPI00075F94DB|nr:HNH endonuclease signature motif containing protein [Burkholderia stagnalis]KWO32141.1 hypothetical protein WT95_00695 [Burkholderia stagnalis]